VVDVREREVDEMRWWNVCQFDGKYGLEEYLFVTPSPICKFCRPANIFCCCDGGGGFVFRSGQVRSGLVWSGC
jgi:hypothetical protein